jgi:hypothetical protein
MDDAVRLMREDCGDAGGCVNIQNGVPSSACTILAQESTLVLGCFILCSSSSHFGFMRTTSARLKKFLGLIRTGSNILDMVVEDGETGHDVGGSLSDRSKSFSSIKVRDSQREDGLGSDSASEPLAFLRITNAMDNNRFQIKKFGGPRL